MTSVRALVVFAVAAGLALVIAVGVGCGTYDDCYPDCTTTTVHRCGEAGDPRCEP